MWPTAIYAGFAAIVINLTVSIAGAAYDLADTDEPLRRHCVRRQPYHTACEPQPYLQARKAVYLDASTSSVSSYSGSWPGSAWLTHRTAYGNDDRLAMHVKALCFSVRQSPRERFSLATIGLP